MLESKDHGKKNHFSKKNRTNQSRMKAASPLVLGIVLGVILVVVLIATFTYVSSSSKNSNRNKKNETKTEISNDVKEENGQQGNTLDPNSDKEVQPTDEAAQEEARLAQEKEERETLIQNADLYAAQYDYKKAKKLIKKYEGYEQYEELTSKLEEYKNKEATLVPYGAFESINEISHVFFHSLIVDTDKAFDGDYMENGYNYWMTTVSEFKAMLNEMYQNGYVLVSIHDIVSEKKQEDGTVKMELGDLLLPPDKKPFVLSQDDTNFYEYMKEDGFATRILIDENGYPACEVIRDGKSIIDRDFDVVPILEKFIEEHPDFSYHGARGLIGVTGYEGVMGYRTNEKEAPNYKELVEEATKTADRLKELGWEFASHSYGHGHMGKMSTAEVKQDSDHWDFDIASIVGKTDVLLYPYGEEIEDTLKKYTTDKYPYLYKLGFRYFCGVCSYPWIQVQDEYVRMTRRNLDGYTMHFYPERLSDLFDVSKVYDSSRPEFKE